MWKTFSGFTFLGIIGLCLLQPEVFAEDPKNPSKQTAINYVGDLCLFAREPACWDAVINVPWGEMKTFSQDPKISSFSCNYRFMPGDDAYTYINLSDPYGFDNMTAMAPIMVDEFEDLNDEGDMDTGIVVGVKYFFKCFQFDRFKSSILSFFRRSKKTDDGTPPAVAFYFDVP